MGSTASTTPRPRLLHHTVPTFFITSTGQVDPAITPVRSEPSWYCWKLRRRCGQARQQRHGHQALAAWPAWDRRRRGIAGTRH